MAERVSRNKWWVFAGVTIAGSALCGMMALFALDLYLHHKYGKIAGYNVRGYRGAVLGRKSPGEIRVAVVGGSTALGYGVAPHESYPAYLESLLNTAFERPDGATYRVVNLAWNNEGAYSFQFTLRDYAYLDYDVAILYEGYNDLGRNRSVFRHESPVFRLTGYLPIFPMILKEKAMAIRYGGKLEDAYWGKQTVFKPNLAQRATAGALETAVSVSKSLEHQLGRLSERPVGDEPALGAGGCGDRWNDYCHSMQVAVEYLLDRGRKAIVVTQPYATDDHRAQQEAMAAMVQARFGADPSFRYVNLGHTIDLKDTALCYDGMHLVGEGNRRIAAALAGPVHALMSGEARIAASGAAERLAQ